MGILVALDPDRRPRRRPAHPGGTAAVVLVFTGVRYAAVAEPIDHGERCFEPEGGEFGPTGRCQA